MRAQEDPPLSSLSLHRTSLDPPPLLVNLTENARTVHDGKLGGRHHLGCDIPAGHENGHAELHYHW